MQKNGLLTIGIPTYNGGGNLPQLLASVKNLGLAYDAYELLIVDNDSTDGTESIVESLKPQYGNIVFYKNKKNIGRVENWNEVLRLAKGEFLILMNVNDQFLEIDLNTHLDYLKNNPDVALVMNDVISADYRYPNWTVRGLIDLKAYIRKTFLDADYLEFHSLGVLQQHIFRTQTIRKHDLRFNPGIPRTTDRVFTAAAIKHGGGKFFYTAEPIVKWQPTANRYHHQVHHNGAHSNFDQLWLNEYEANAEIARIAEIPFAKMIKGQMVSACFLKLANWVRQVKRRALKRQYSDDGLEIMTAYLYYNHLKVVAALNNVSPNYFIINWLAFKRAVVWFLRSLNVQGGKARFIEGVRARGGSTNFIGEHYV